MALDDLIYSTLSSFTEYQVSSSLITVLDIHHFDMPSRWQSQKGQPDLSPFCSFKTQTRLLGNVTTKKDHTSFSFLELQQTGTNDKTTKPALLSIYTDRRPLLFFLSSVVVGQRSLATPRFVFDLRILANVLIIKSSTVAARVANSQR